MNIVKIYQLFCCMACCHLLCIGVPNTFAKKRRGKAYKKYLATIKKANDLLLKHDIHFSKLKAMFLRFNTRGPRVRHRRKRNVHVNFAQHVIMALPTNVMRCRIFCRSGLYLQLLPNGLVKGTRNQYDPHILLELQSFGPSLVRIKSVYSSRYLTIDAAGKLKTQHPQLQDSLFKEVQEENSYNSYSSYKYFYDEPYDIFVGLRSTGQIKKTWKAYPGQIATQFLVIKDVNLLNL
ncbi:fibroblast growth factor 1-like isoform X2 [Rhopilema esculentum]|uniref:fibroblast growth factor 1-like isoform X2 n=1 Tax=Rhopilema esculentum TaxID=499914 RepID=UPI0031CE10CF